MYLLTGSNLFGQWLCEEYVFETFKLVPVINNNLQSLNVSGLKVCYIGWSYNVFLVDKHIYLSGSFKGLDNQCIPINLPEECDTSEMIISGNDYNLVLAGKNSQTIWIMDLDMKNEIKKISLNIETPIQNSKKMKKEDGVVKVVMMNDMCLYLTSSGMVYDGLLPSYVDTTHCIGKVCDIQCGYEHCLLLTDTGRVYTWGNGRRLQLGHGDVSNQDVPVELEALAGINIVKIAAGGWHSMALSQSGDLYSWGWNDTGQLGIRVDNSKESLKSEGIPTLVDIYDGNCIVEKNIKDIACGSKHSMVLLEDNSVWTSGCNKYGQLGMSIQKNEKLYYFMKTYQCEKIIELMSGSWCSVLKCT